LVGTPSASSADDRCRSQAIRHDAAGRDPINCRAQALDRGVHGHVIRMPGSAEAVMPPYGSRSNDPLNAAGAERLEPEDGSSGASCPDRGERYRSAARAQA